MVTFGTQTRKALPLREDCARPAFVREQEVFLSCSYPLCIYFRFGLKDMVGTSGFEPLTSTVSR
jgi:hypothetical protein